jgi:competence protein ComK
MNKILSHYIINAETMAILPAKQIDYQAVTIETNQKLYLKPRPLEIIKENCIHYGSTYEGRKTAVLKKLGLERKVPIPISISKNLFSFPTLSPNSFDCAWIFYHHVRYIEPLRTPYPKEQQSILYFHNGTSIILDVSEYVLWRQMERTRMCMFTFSEKMEYWNININWT